MSNPSRRKGSSWEKSVVDFLNARQVFSNEVHRAPLWGAQDRGDLVNTGSFSFECKAHRTLDLAGWVEQAERQAHHANARWGVVVAKRRNHQTPKAYVVLTLDAFAEIVKELPVEHRR